MNPEHESSAQSDIEAVRARFEDRFSFDSSLPFDFDKNSHTGDYTSPATYFTWKGYQAGLAARDEMLPTKITNEMLKAGRNACERYEPLDNENGVYGAIFESMLNAATNPKD